MAFYTDRSIALVAEKNNLVDVASLYVTLRRNGSDYVARCPFHNEKTPSFHINEDKQLFYCFGCGAGGNIFDFVERIENLDFVDAVKFLAQRAGVTLEEEQRGGGRILKEDYHEKRIRLFEINRLAARHFLDNLLTPDAKAAQEYAKKRGITSQSIKEFGLGFAKDEWSDLLSFLKSKGYDENEIIEAGLAVRNEKNKVYDKFRNRLMFPIIDIRGNVIGFGGRALGDDKAKYMNSPETPIFQKGKNLYGLNLAKKISKESGVVLVEGNMDVVSLYTNGIKNAVAGLGTAFTPEQAQLLSRYAREVFVCYDNDEAGRKAALKNIDILLDSGNRVKVVEITGAKDPDEYILKKGAEKFKELLKTAHTALEYKILMAKNKFDLTDTSGKLDFVAEAAKMLSTVSNSVEREIYVRNISRDTGVSEKAISDEINKLSEKKKSDARRAERRPSAMAEIAAGSGFSKKEGISLSSGQNKNTYRSERMLLNLVFYYKQALSETEAAGGEELFSAEINKAVYAQIKKFREKFYTQGPAEFLSYVPDEMKKTVTAVLFSEFSMDDVKVAAKDVINKLKGEQMKSRIDSLVKEGNLNEAMKLIKLQKEGGNL